MSNRSHAFHFHILGMIRLAKARNRPQAEIDQLQAIADRWKERRAEHRKAPILLEEGQTTCPSTQTSPEAKPLPEAQEP